MNSTMKVNFVKQHVQIKITVYNKQQVVNVSRDIFVIINIVFIRVVVGVQQTMAFTSQYVYFNLIYHV